MAEPAPFKEQAEAVKLRQSPRPITRVNRKMLVIGAGLGALLLAAGMAVALSPPTMAPEDAPREVYAQRTSVPEGLSNMPASYADMSVPELGPALPGEFGATLLQAERDQGLSPPVQLPYRAEPFQPDPVMDQMRAERLRQAELTRAANEAPVFFQLSGTKGIGGSAPPQASRVPAAGQFPSLDAFAALANPAVPQSPSDQDRKRAFAGEGIDTIYNPYRVEAPASPYQVMAGSIIPASLITGVNSDLPGTVIAQVSQNVFDTVSGRYLLIPQGTRLVGRYDSGVTFGQDRALLVWDRIIFPDGRSLLIGGLPGADATGQSGLRDRVDHHWDRIAGAAALATLLGIGTELATDDDAGEIGRAVRDAFQDTGARAGERMIDRQLSIQPTIRIRPGARVQVIVTRDLILEPLPQNN